MPGGGGVEVGDERMIDRVSKKKTEEKNKDTSDAHLQGKERKTSGAHGLKH